MSVENLLVTIAGFGAVTMTIRHYFGDVIKYTLFSKKSQS